MCKTIKVLHVLQRKDNYENNKEQEYETKRNKPSFNEIWNPTV